MSITLYGVDGQVYPVPHVGLYSDNTPYVKLPDFDVEIYNTMLYQHETVTQFMAAMLLVDSIAERGGKVDNLVIPYFPGARQDRINPTGDVLFSLKGYADMVLARHFKKVLILDPHSEATLDKLATSWPWSINSNIAMEWQLNDYAGVIIPDQGATVRSVMFAAFMNISKVVQAEKHRDVSTGALSGFSVDVEPGHYLVVDDICDGGGTFLGLGEKIKEQGATADLYVTHGIFSKGTRELHKYYKNIYTTDSLHQSAADRVIVIPVVERMVQDV